MQPETYWAIRQHKEDVEAEYMQPERVKTGYRVIWNAGYTNEVEGHTLHADYWAALDAMCADYTEDEIDADHVAIATYFSDESREF